MKEEWRDIKGFEGYYKISNLCRIISLPKKNNVNLFNKHKTTTITREKIIKGSKDKDGYVVINLKVGTKLRKFKVHRLVAIAFLKEDKARTLINHKNGIKDDNRADNLEWVSSKENAIHAHSVLFDETHHYYRERLVSQYTLDGVFLKIHKSITRAALDAGISKSAVCDCCKGKISQAGSYVWRYAETDMNDLKSITL